MDRINTYEKKSCDSRQYIKSFPIVHTEGSNPYNDYCFTSVFNGYNVHVRDPTDIYNLYNSGFFGKGSLSKSFPTYGRKESVLTQAQWARRQKWLEDMEGDSGSVESSEQDPEALDQKNIRKVLVLENLKFDDEGHPSQVSCTLKPEVKCPVEETLVLLLEEAFFLAWALGCLKVRDNFQRTLTMRQIWEEFNKAEPDFITRYAAYHHLRSKGWVPKSGLSFGADFLIYKKGPPFYHASCMVIVSSGTPMTWGQGAALYRLAETSRKDVLVLEVTNSQGVEIQSPGDLTKLRVKETLLSQQVQLSQPGLLIREQPQKKIQNTEVQK